METAAHSEIHQEGRTDTISSEGDDKSVTGNDENRVLKWLQVVDRHIEEDSVEIMKLGMQAELTQNERDNAKKPADIYHALANHYDSGVLLSRYVYGLEKLGHRRHGFRAVNKLKDFSIEKPVQFTPTGDPDKVQEFNFCQCLVEISVHLDTRCHSRLIAYAAKMFLDGANPAVIKTPYELFIILLQNKKITKDDQNELLDALKIIGADRSIEYIHSYRHQNGLSEIGDKDYNKATLRSTASSKTDEPGSRTQTLKRNVYHDHQYSQGNPKQATENKEALPPRSSSKRIAWTACIIMLTVVAFVLLGITTATLLMNKSSVILHHDNATVILTQVHHFFTRSLTVIQDTGYPGDTDHEIDLYLLNGMCNDLLTIEVNYTITGNSHDLSNANKTILYLLPSSLVTYSVCASTNHTKNPDRLELLVVDNLERAKSLHNIANSFYTFAFFRIGIEEDIMCDEVTISIEAAGYYCFIFFPPSHPASFELNATYTIRSIDPIQLSVGSNYTLHKNQDSHEFPLDSSPRAKTSCLIATIKRASKPYVHIQLHMKAFLEVKIGLGIGIALFMAAVSLIIIVICMLCYHHKCPCISSHWCSNFMTLWSHSCFSCSISY